MHIIIYSTICEKKNKQIFIHIGSVGLYIYFGIRATVELLENKGVLNLKWYQSYSQIVKRKNGCYNSLL